MLQTYLEGIQEDSVLDLVISSLPEEAKSKGTDTTLQLNQKVNLLLIIQRSQLIFLLVSLCYFQFDTLKGTLRHFSLIPPGGGGILAHSLAHIASWLKVFAIMLLPDLTRIFFCLLGFFSFFAYSSRKWTKLMEELNLLLRKLICTWLRIN